MLDMVMNYLLLVKKMSGGVNLPDEGKSPVKKASSVAKIIDKKAVAEEQKAPNNLMFYGGG